MWLARYEHPPAGAAVIVISTALEDFEDLAAQLDTEGIVAVSELMQLAATESGELTALASALPRLRVPARMFLRDQLDLKPGRSGLTRAVFPWAPAGCGACRTVYDVREVMSAGLRNRRGDLLAQNPAPVSGYAVSYRAGREGLAGRVALYRQLSVVLRSTHSAS